MQEWLSLPHAGEVSRGRLRPRFCWKKTRAVLGLRLLMGLPSQNVLFNLRWLVELDQNFKWNSEIFWIIIGSSWGFISMRASLFPNGFFLCVCVFQWRKRDRWLWPSGQDVRLCHYRNPNLDVNSLPGFWVFGPWPSVVLGERVSSVSWGACLLERVPPGLAGFVPGKPFLKAHVHLLEEGPPFISGQKYQQVVTMIFYLILKFWFLERKRYRRKKEL